MNSFKSKQTLNIGNKKYTYYDLNIAAKELGINLAKLPFSLRVLFENLLRNEDGKTVTKDDIVAIADWLKNKKSSHEIAYYPARVLMQDFTGVPAVVDLAAMRDAMKELGGDPKKINPSVPVDLVIDHSVQVDSFGSGESFTKNVEMEFDRNRERYEFLKWGQSAFDNFSVVPPGTGICHQVNLEYLAKTVWQKTEDGETILYPDTLVGTDSHTTMINGLAVLGWGVGGIEAESVMLGQAISMIIPEVVGFKLTGKLGEGMTATDLVLTVTNMLRKQGVVGKFVEFYGDGLKELSLADRATIANMAPEYGATCGFFPIDQKTIDYLEFSGREKEQVELVEAYAKAQNMWLNSESPDPEFTNSLELDLSIVEPSLAGPKRPQDKINLRDMKKSFSQTLTESNSDPLKEAKVEGQDYTIQNGDIVIAAITSCTNTSNPSVMLAAGLVAKKAIEKGLKVKPWVKTSLAPGSKVVTDYFEKSDLQRYLDELGFNLVGYGCTTCIGNSGPLKAEIENAITENDLTVTSVLSGNRNFEGRVHPLTKANYLASPPLVVAYSLFGNMNGDITRDAIGQDQDGNDVYLKDIWPSTSEVEEIVKQSVTPEMFKKRYAAVFYGDEYWQKIKVEKSDIYNWDDASTYIKNPPYFEGMTQEIADVAEIKNASILALFGNSITTDHISPAGNIAANSPAANYLAENGVEPRDFNSYGSRRGNHEVMMRGTFANIRIKNEMAEGKEGGYTKYIPTGEIMPIYDAAMKYKPESLVVIAGKEYGTGSSRDWAAKGSILLGVKAVIAESFERIHRSNLVGMGVLPLMFTNSENKESLNLKGDEKVDIDFSDNVKAGDNINAKITYASGDTKEIKLLLRIDTEVEMDNYKNGGILQAVIRRFNK